MIRCPKCKVIYRKNTPDKCSLCKEDLTTEKKRESIKEEKRKELYEWINKNEENIKIREQKIKQEQFRIERQKRDLAFSKLKCSKCHSNDLRITDTCINSSEIYIKCNNCGNFDTRKCYDETKGKVGSLVKCDLCGSTTTKILSQTGFPDWIYTNFKYTKNKTLCSKCSNEHYNKLQEKDEEFHNKHLIIEYAFDGDALKYWEKGDEAVDFKEIEVDNDNGKQRYKKAIKEMKKEFPKTTKFIDIDEDSEDDDEN